MFEWVDRFKEPEPKETFKLLPVAYNGFHGNHTAVSHSWTVELIRGRQKQTKK